MAFSRALTQWTLTVPWWLDAPSTMGFYGVLFGLFDNWLWRLPHLRLLGLIKVPDLTGRWTGYVTSSFDQHAERREVAVEISQTWTRLAIRLRSKESRSNSIVASVLTESHAEGCQVVYKFRNEPIVGAEKEMEAHQGTATLYVERDGAALEGDYYSGRGRANEGRIHLSRAAGSPPAAAVYEVRK